jgi:histidinol-phosphate aminotransferase
MILKKIETMSNCEKQIERLPFMNERTSMNKYWSETLRCIDPYVPGEQPKGRKIVKLNTNESPYPPSPRVLEAIRKAVNEDLRRYPDPNSDELRKAIADYHGIGMKQVFVGNGSDEILAFCFMAFFNPNERILFPDITYSFYPVYAKLYGIPYKEIALTSDFSVPIREFITENYGIIIPNPNAPTGKCLDADSLLTIVNHNLELGKVAIVDEAYIDFGGESLIKFIDRFPNLLIVQTLSKSRSLAGLRVGLALGSEGLIEGLSRIKNSINSYTLDRLAILGAAEAFRDVEYFQTNCKKIIGTREWVEKELSAIGFDVIPSKANFLFAAHKSMNAAELSRKLREREIFVRHFKKPRIENYLRISIGSDAEMKFFLTNLREIFKL